MLVLAYLQQQRTAPDYVLSSAMQSDSTTIVAPADPESYSHLPRLKWMDTVAMLAQVPSTDSEKVRCLHVLLLCLRSQCFYQTYIHTYMHLQPGIRLLPLNHQKLPVQGGAAESLRAGRHPGLGSNTAEGGYGQRGAASRKRRAQQASGTLCAGFTLPSGSQECAGVCERSK